MKTFFFLEAFFLWLTLCYQQGFIEEKALLSQKPLFDIVLNLSSIVS